MISKALFNNLLEISKNRIIGTYDQDRNYRR